MTKVLKKTRKQKQQVVDKHVEHIKKHLSHFHISTFPVLSWREGKENVW